MRPGDVIGVCAPSGAVDAERLDKGVAVLRGLGFEVRVPDGVLERARFTAGTAARRLGELHALFSDDAVAAIVCARGGAGTAQLLEGLDTGLLRSHPKAFVGCSDITALHLVLNELGLVTFHGPMVAVDFAAGSYHRESFLHALTGAGAPYASEEDDLLPLCGGTAEGRLRGGCLSLLASAAGTPWALRPDEEGTVLFLEDVDEAPYRIDRLLVQLRQSGGLAGVRGLVFGDMKGCAPPLAADFGLEDVILDALAGIEVPIALGLSSGHASGPQVTLPLGARVRLACGGAARFQVLEPAVA